MVAVTADLADRVSAVARLLAEDEQPEATLRRVTGLCAELLPGTGIALTVAVEGGGWTFAESDTRLDDLHRLQFDSGDGPVPETLRYNEPRRVDDTRQDRRWPEFSRQCARSGFGSLLVLPLGPDRQPPGAIALYSAEPRAFHGSAHDISVLLAAQGGAALRNARLYHDCRELVGQLHAALAARAVIEQAKGVLHAELGISPDEAFDLMRRESQHTNRKVRDISADMVAGRIDPSSFTRRGPDRR